MDKKAIRKEMVHEIMCAFRDYSLGNEDVGYVTSILADYASEHPTIGLDVETMSKSLNLLGTWSDPDDWYPEMPSSWC